MSIATRERPILMSAPMIRAIQEGRKSQTRRVVKLRNFGPSDTPGYDWTFRRDRDGCWEDYRHAEFLAKFCPHGAVGDRLWVRETFAPRLNVDPAAEPEKARHYALYRADGTSLDDPHWHAYPDRWTPSIFMPRWASRITLEITEVRVERLTAISEADAMAEGCKRCPTGCYVFEGTGYDKAGLCHSSPEIAFACLWDEINGDGSWDRDDYVWALTFRRIEEGGSA